jgi:ABC-type transport system involved in multi-copper enzyme maturation permease subunit
VLRPAAAYNLAMEPTIEVAGCRSGRSAGRDGFARLLRAEFTKFRTVRGWVIALCAAAVVFVLLSSFSAWQSHYAEPAVPTGPGGEAVADTYMLVHQALAGDGALTARVTSFSEAHTPADTSGGAFGASSKGGPSPQLQRGLVPWAKAGIILEPDTNQGTAYAAMMVTGSHGVQMQYNYTHDSPGLPGRVGPSSPRWLRLTRAGDVIAGYDSLDGAHWTQIGTARLTGLPRTVQIGMFVTSPVYFADGAAIGTSSVATASFDQVSARGDLPRRSWTPDAITGSGYYPYGPSTPTWRQMAAGAFTISGSGDMAPLVGDIMSPQWAGASIVNGTIAALLFVIVIGALFATSEYRRGLIRTTFAASPRRGRVVAAKAVVAGSLAFAAGVVATAIAEVITRHVLTADGSYLFPQSGPALARVIVGTGLFLGLAAALAVALGMMLRRSAVTVASAIVLLVVPGVLGSQSGNWLMRFTPTAAFAIQATLPRSSLVTSAYTPPNGYFPVSPWAGLAVLAAYAAVALGAATWLVRRRDA